MPSRDWTLLAIASAEGDCLTPVQLQKSLFLLGKRFPDEVGDDFYDFQPYNYGPFDVAVYHDAEALASDGLVVINRPAGRWWNDYSITDRGREAAAQSRRSLPADAVDYLRRAVAWTRSLTFPQLVSKIYQLYPEYRANSVFQEP